MKTSRTARRAIIYRPTTLQIESWRLLWEEFTHDALAVAEFREWERRRMAVRPQMLELLQQFQSGSVDVAELRATFDQRTKTSWDVFGLRGASGAMFLNKLVKYVPDSGDLATHLRAALTDPASVDEGRVQLRGFIAFLRALVRAGGANARQLQPARSTFFVTIWWHLQKPELWPGFQLSARTALQLEEGLYVPTEDPVEDYFTFRETYLALASALDLTTWDLEYLCWWHQHRERRVDSVSLYEAGRMRAPRVVRARSVRAPVVRAAASAVESDTRRARATIDHTHIQWLLATIGKQLGCRVWVAANDRSKEWNGELLGSLSIRRFPSLGMDPDSQRVISLIDVVWFRGPHQVAAAFEVERTSAVYSGLLRMADLAALSPNLNFPLYVVVPEARMDKVRRELSRPTFRMLELDRRCAFFSGEALIEAADSIMRWGNTPAVMERLAHRVAPEYAPGE